MASKVISIRGAREHNLKSVQVDIPRDQLVVLTGLSGSGKSSLAFDTVYAEGQRKYMESLSAYARQFLEQLRKPDIDSIEGLPPTIAIEQRSASHNPRSTVATTTEIYDYLRLLFARAGQPHCWHQDEDGQSCGQPITRQSATQMVEQIWRHPPGTRVMIIAPLVRGKKGQHKEIFEALLRQGLPRARVNAKVIHLQQDGPPTLTRYQAHTIEAVIDRVVVKDDPGSSARARVADSVELCLKQSGGLMVLAVADPQSPDDWRDELFSENHACANHPQCSLEDLEPRLFSFNSPYGACQACDGLGTIMEFDSDLIVPDPTVSLSEGAVSAWRRHGKRMNIYYNRLIRRFCRDFGISPTDPYQTLSKTIRRILMDGTKPRDEAKYGARFEGVIPNLQRRWQTTDSEYVKARLHHYLSEAPCEACGGGAASHRIAACHDRRARSNGQHRTDHRDDHRKGTGILFQAETGQRTSADCRPDRQGNQSTPRLHAECRTQLPDPRPYHGYSLRRGEPADPPGDSGWLRPGRVLLRLR